MKWERFDNIIGKHCSRTLVPIMMFQPKIRQFAYPLGAPTGLHQMPECNGTTPPRVASLMDRQLTPARCVTFGIWVRFILTLEIPFVGFTFRSGNRMSLTKSVCSVPRRSDQATKNCTNPAKVTWSLLTLLKRFEYKIILAVGGFWSTSQSHSQRHQQIWTKIKIWVYPHFWKSFDHGR